MTGVVWEWKSVQFKAVSFTVKLHPWALQLVVMIVGPVTLIVFLILCFVTVLFAVLISRLGGQRSVCLFTSSSLYWFLATPRRSTSARRRRRHGNGGLVCYVIGHSSAVTAIIKFAWIEIMVSDLINFVCKFIQYGNAHPASGKKVKIIKFQECLVPLH